MTAGGYQVWSLQAWTGKPLHSCASSGLKTRIIVFLTDLFEQFRLLLADQTSSGKRLSLQPFLFNGFIAILTKSIRPVIEAIQGRINVMAHLVPAFHEENLSFARAVLERTIFGISDRGLSKLLLFSSVLKEQRVYLFLNFLFSSEQHLPKCVEALIVCRHVFCLHGEGPLFFMVKGTMSSDMLFKYERKIMGG